MKIIIPVIVFYGNKKYLFGVCMMIFIHTVTFKNYFYYRKVLCVCLAAGLKCVGFAYVIFESV